MIVTLLIDTYILRKKIHNQKKNVVIDEDTSSFMKVINPTITFIRF